MAIAMASGSKATPEVCAARSATGNTSTAAAVLLSTLVSAQVSA